MLCQQGHNVVRAMTRFIIVGCFGSSMQREGRLAVCKILLHKPYINIWETLHDLV